MIYIRLFFVFSWLMISCAVGLFGCLIRYGDLNLDHYFGHFFAWGVTRISRIRVTHQGLEHLSAHQPCIYVANHQSGMDMSNFGTIYPKRTVLVGKKELAYIPFFGLFFKAAGNIMINRSKRVSAMASLAGAVEQIKAKNLSVWVFPEGTRNQSQDLLLPFKKGAFYMAIQAQVPIVPIVCSPLDGVLRWKDKYMPGGDVCVRILPPVSTKGYGERDAEKLGHLVREQMIAALTELKDFGRRA
jgi:1-acyl-sn-glycerol-3-phosphate acyltransferase